MPETEPLLGWRPQLSGPQFHARRHGGRRSLLFLLLERQAAGHRRHLQGQLGAVPGPDPVRQPLGLL